MASYKHHVFLSYDHRDAQTMLSIRKYLQANGLEAWTDERIIPGTPNWRRKIENALDECGCMVVIFTPYAKESTEVSREIDYAAANKKQIIPFVVSGDPKKSLMVISTQYIDASDFDSGARKLVDAIRNHLELPIIQPDAEYKIPILGEDTFPADTLKNYDELGKTTKQVLFYINEHKAEHDRPPTIREIESSLHLSSTSVVAYHLEKLKREGFLEQEEKLARGTIVVKRIPKHHVFLSYSLADQDKAYQIEKILVSKGLRVCTIEPSGSKFTRLSRLQAEIRNSCCLILIMSPNAKHSIKVLSHLICAQENQTAIIPLLVSGNPIDSIPTTLPEKFYDISESFDTKLEPFIDAVLGYLGRLI